MASTAMIEGLEKKRKIEEEWRSIYATKQSLTRADFPPDFTFGVATAAFQVEGACDEDGRGPSIWDAFSHAPGNICDGSNAHVAVDQYHRYKEDIELIANWDLELTDFLYHGVVFFQVCDSLLGIVEISTTTAMESIWLSNTQLCLNEEWYVQLADTISADGLGTKVNIEGIRHYNNVINALLDKGMKLVFSSFGDRVKNWITINEPLQTAVNGYYTGVYAPGRREHSSNEPYLVAHHQLLAHAEAVSIYNKKYKDKQGGQIGLVVDCEWSEALSDRVEDRNATTRRLDFQLGWFLDPICFGDYPETMREKLGDRLPKFSERHKELLKNSVDFIGLNHYTTRFVCHATVNREDNDFYRVQEVERIAEWEGGETIGSIALALYGSLGHMESSRLHFYEIQQSPVYITENGMDDEEDETSPFNHMLDDKLRVSYYKGYLAAIHQAIKDGANVRGYFAWSLLDNFEWHLGYTKRFGLIYVDYKNGLTRHLKSSAYWFSQFLKAEGGA
ncbi:Beta-glucosidase 42 [Sesamum angolense]|uniref:Beta-glucosidase 42 n=1 Tax=Sesamum angolense TaxID=2727404 RepID=A0AAE1W2T5_9LAMI|nr:Beta-glucosidase 42 [Sesamum angolense]